MSLSEARKLDRCNSRRRFWRIAAAVALTLPLLSACADGTSGFRPLHGPTASGANLGDVLARIDVKKIPGRVGQRIRNELIYQNNGGAQPQEPVYDLQIVIREKVLSTLVQKSGESLSQIYNLDVNFKLVDRQSKKVLVEGKSYGRAGFERFTSIYANVRAKEDAENRAATSVAREIKGRLAAYLSSKA